MPELSLFSDCGAETRVTCERRDNAVAVKRKLRDIIYHNEHLIELFHRGEPVPNNGYLDDRWTQLDYRISAVAPDDVIIRVARNNYNVPELIQISRKESIGDLESILIGFSDSVGSLAIFSEDDTQLPNDRTVHQCGLTNESEIRICDQKNVHLVLSVANILPVQNTFKISCGILDSVQTVKQQICDTFNLQADEMALFSQTEFLETKKQLIDYFIKNEDLIFYVDLIKKNEIEIGKKFKSGKFATLHLGKNLTTNTEIIVKRYSLKKGDKLMNFKPLKYEIITFLQLRSEEEESDSWHDRFVKMDSMGEADSKFFIGMEYMAGGSLNNRLPLTPHPEKSIIHFSIQILEGLDYLHRKRILYRSMKCSSVLLDKEAKNVKLCSFHLSKFMLDCDVKRLLEGMIGSNAVDCNWAAPEILLGQKYGIKADIWSFGATLIEMATGKAPYAGLTPAKVRRVLSEEKKISYVQPEWMSDDLKSAIEICLRPVQDQRPTTQKLREIFIDMWNKQSGITDIFPIKSTRY